MTQKDSLVITKTSIKKELLRWNGQRPFMSISELAEARHIGRDAARALVQDLDYIPQGRRKDYLVEDLATRLAELKESGGVS